MRSFLLLSLIVAANAFAPVRQLPGAVHAVAPQPTGIFTKVQRHLPPFLTLRNSKGSRFPRVSLNRMVSEEGEKEVVENEAGVVTEGEWTPANPTATAPENPSGATNAWVETADDDASMGKKIRIIIYGVISLVPILLIVPFILPSSLVPTDPPPGL